jgi:hypothetical protein
MAEENHSQESPYIDGERVAEHTETNHTVPIGIPIGACLAIIGAFLAIYGIVGSPENAKSLGINMNLWWGLFMVAFGCVVLGLSWASPRRREAARAARATRS